MKPEEQLRLLKDFTRSDIWQLIRQALQDDIARATLDLAANSNMPDTEMHYRRGSLRAAHAFLNLPDALYQRVQNDLLIEAAKAASPRNSAKAEKL